MATQQTKSGIENTWKCYKQVNNIRIIISSFEDLDNVWFVSLEEIVKRFLQFR